jgi:hypothetical protein
MFDQVAGATKIPKGPPLLARRRSLLGQQSGRIVAASLLGGCATGAAATAEAAADTLVGTGRAPCRRNLRCDLERSDQATLTARDVR